MDATVTLGELLVSRNKLSPRDLERALIAQQEMGGRLGQVLAQLGLVSELDVAEALSEQLGISLVRAADYPDVVPEVRGLAIDFLLSKLIVPLTWDGERLRAVAAVPQDPFVRKALELATGGTVELALGLESDITQALERLGDQGVADEAADGLGAADQYAGDEEFIEHLRDLASEAPVIRLVNQIIHRAVDLAASDVHIEPFEDGLHLRYRIDGIIQEVPDPPRANLAPAIASRIKLLANLNIAERRLPQDGRIMTRVKGHELDLRVSTIPTVHGESLVMRVLDRQSIHLKLEKMGFSEDTLSRYSELLQRPHGVLLLTGPTGSGKTTTLYASLSTLDARALKIITVEDPVEYQLGGINQLQVQPQIELTFARALRSILRQDPDIIMIGEMRDTETAQIAVQSALTGHLVLSTLHTNTAAGAITRLEDMGVERFLITSAVNGVLAQRLVRTLCPQCRRLAALEQGTLHRSGLSRWLPAGQREVYTAVGCDACKHTGYSGRTAIHELFVVDSDMHHAIQSGADATALHAAAREQGMLTLYEDGIRRVAEGVTSLEEVLRVTQDQSHEDAGV